MKPPSPKRIALIVPVFPVLSETFIVRQWLGLLDRGWDVHMVCQRFDRQAWNRAEDLKRRPDLRRRVHAVGPTRSKRRVLLNLPRALGRLAKHLPATFGHARRVSSDGLTAVARRLYLDAPLIVAQPDLIHFEFGTLAPQRMDLKDHFNAKIVVSFRGFDLNFAGLDDESYYDPVWQSADRLHFLGKDLRRRALARGCPSDMPHALIPPAVDSELFSPDTEHALPEQRSAEAPLHIVSVGRLEWKKGYDYALRAVHLLKQQGLQLTYTLIGDGSEMQSVAYARHELGLRNEVQLLGARPRSEVLDQLRRADVFLHPAVSEGFCNAVLEAQAMELPVVTTSADGLAENIRDGETGFMVARRDPEALAQKLELLARDPELRRRMGRSGRRRIQEKFRPEQEIQAFEQLYLETLSAGGALS